MNWISGKRLALGAAALLCASVLAPAERSQVPSSRRIIPSSFGSEGISR